MHWLIQSSLRDDNLHRIKSALDKTNSSYTFFGFTIDEVYTGLDYSEFKKHDRFISISYIKGLRLSHSEFISADNFSNNKDLSKKELTEVIDKIKHSYFYEDPKKFDQYYYANLNLPMVNKNPIFLKIEDNLNASFTEDKFIKPSSDTKAFNGGIIKAGETIEQYVTRTTHQKYWMQEFALISELQEIDKEYRFFVLNKEVLTGSMYMVNGVVKTSPIIPSDVLSIAQEYSKLYSPSEVFGMDIAVMKNGEYKIMEYNPFNCSGIYECDMVKVFSILNEYYKNKAS